MKRKYILAIKITLAILLILASLYKINKDNIGKTTRVNINGYDIILIHHK